MRNVMSSKTRAAMMEMRTEEQSDARELMGPIDCSRMAEVLQTAEDWRGLLRLLHTDLLSGREPSHID